MSLQYGDRQTDRTEDELDESDGVLHGRFLESVEHQIGTLLEHANPSVKQIVAHLARTKGKRIRPRLVLAGASWSGPPHESIKPAVDAAAAVELLHLASLYHDDVLDSAETRRGQPSTNSLWGNNRAVLGGDLLLARAYESISSLGQEHAKVLSSTLVELCAGQIAECDSQFNTDRTVAQYTESIGSKTASLLATSCWLGANVAGAEHRTTEAYRTYGRELGFAFQVVDDVLDLFADESVIGKPTGNDLREGVYTLPVLIALQKDSELAPRLVRGITDNDIAVVRDRVEEVGAAQEAVDIATLHARAAVDAIASVGIAESTVRSLERLARRVLGNLESAGFIGGPWAWHRQERAEPAVSSTSSSPAGVSVADLGA